MEQITLAVNNDEVRGVVALPASKSIANRLLVMNALAANVITINNLSQANDTRLLHSILDELSFNTISAVEIDCHDAGTVMRFLTAFFAITEGKWLLKGTERMHQRPIGILVEKLKELGADIEYLHNEGYPPLLINGTQLKGGEIRIDAGISSQYISALMMIAPYLKNGLTLKLEGKITSKPYISLTTGLMQQCGVHAGFVGNVITIPEGKYKATKTTVESDWSAASYWYAVAAVANRAEIQLNGLLPDSLQGDSVVARLMEEFGVTTTFTNNGVLIKNGGTVTNHFEHDFTDCPDLGPTFIALCGAMGIPARFYGLESLAIKESDRTAALATELKKVGVVFEQNGEYWQLIPNNEALNSSKTIEFDTYNDHRLAMALSVFSIVLSEIKINNPQVIIKSYPTFWDDFMQIMR
ncbi:3-phosphoshikimate 1-carboxyvinyltransferase [Oscillatoria amoena NRMC-F 0135]|nr:3-phosphoshikimate 1-carboxyvinyltransferase [Oscillatoria amoena NRMC-F 0135]